jgi:hypothetical protein
LAAQAFQVGEGRVDFIEVQHRGLFAHCIEGQHAANAQDDLLPQAQVRVALVESRGQVALSFGRSRNVGANSLVLPERLVRTVGQKRGAVVLRVRPDALACEAQESANSLPAELQWVEDLGDCTDLRTEVDGAVVIARRPGGEEHHLGPVGLVLHLEFAPPFEADGEERLLPLEGIAVEGSATQAPATRSGSGAPPPMTRGQITALAGQRVVPRKPMGRLRNRHRAINMVAPNGGPDRHHSTSSALVSCPHPWPRSKFPVPSSNSMATR